MIWSLIYFTMFSNDAFEFDITNCKRMKYSHDWWIPIGKAGEDKRSDIKMYAVVNNQIIKNALAYKQTML